MTRFSPTQLRFPELVKSWKACGPDCLSGRALCATADLGYSPLNLTTACSEAEKTMTQDVTLACYLIVGMPLVEHKTGSFYKSHQTDVCSDCWLGKQKTAIGLSLTVCRHENCHFQPILLLWTKSSSWGCECNPFISRGIFLWLHKIQSNKNESICCICNISDEEIVQRKLHSHFYYSIPGFCSCKMTFLLPSQMMSYRLDDF